MTVYEWSYGVPFQTDDTNNEWSYGVPYVLKLSTNVPPTVTALEESLDYWVLKYNQLTKSLDYLVYTTPSALTESLDYLVKTTPTALTEELDYYVKTIHQLTEELDYLVKTTKYVGYVADPLVNGGFETGDLTGWTYVPSGDVGYDLSYGDEHSGDHSFYIGGDEEGSFSLSQTRDLTGFKYIIFWSRFGGGDIHLKVDTDVLITLDDGDDWVEHVIPISYSGSHKVEFYSDSIPSLVFDLDDVSLSPYLSLDYIVKLQTQLTKDLDYLTRVQPQLTEDLDYYVKVVGTLTEDLDYLTQVQPQLTKDLDYEVKTIQQLTESLSYWVLSPSVSIPLSLDYSVLKANQLTLDLDYWVTVSAVQTSIQLDIDYSVKVSHILNILLSYRIVGEGIVEQVDLEDMSTPIVVESTTRTVTLEAQ